MTAEQLVLADDLETTVVPVRRRDGPHFRRVRESRFITSLERRERDPTHDACIALLVDRLRTRHLEVWTTTFTEEGAVDQKGATLHSQLVDTDYEWWKDEGNCRIPTGDRNYIQPDICGRSRSVFFPTSRQQSIIIEVINTHPPELGTFYTLLELSRYNHLVLFYFVARGGRGSQYSRFREGERDVRLNVSHYMLDGKVYRNGEEVKQYKKSDDEWHAHLLKTYFGTPIRDKR